jgi:5-methylcytosine-specific restriction endonuclease McrA
MRLCGGCQTKIPDDHRGMCAACERDRYGTQPGDGIKSHSNVQQSNVQQHTMAGYDAAMDKLRKCKRWDDSRAKVIRRDGTCVRCKAEGRPPAPIDIVDHIIPAQIAIDQAWETRRFGPVDRNVGYYLLCNLQGLCRSCHAVKTLEDLSHTGPWPNVMDVYDAQPKKVWSF